MNTKVFLRLIACFSIIFFSCHKESSVSKDVLQDEYLTGSSGSIQVSGIGTYATAAQCDNSVLQATYVVRLDGDLTGCLFAYVDSYGCSPSGTYREEGREHFIGTYNGQPGQFWTHYKFEAKYDGCDPSGAPLGLEIFGRCQHPITTGSGTGVFAGVSGRLDMKDDIEAGNFPYRGHLRY